MGDMEDFLLTLLSEVVGMLFEVFIQVIGEAIVALVVRSIRNVVAESQETSPVLAAAGYLLLGVACGAVSVFFFPHPLIHPSKIHGISLLVSPVITGLIMAQVGLLLRRKDKNAVRIESFWYGFTFALGMAFIRFIFIR
jgi:hypothetical protein